MAEKETKNKPKDLIEAVPEELEKVSIEIDEPVQEKIVQKSYAERDKEKSLNSWVPKTELGKAVMEGKEKNFDKILESGKKYIESEIADKLLNLKSDLLLIGQAKGKFGGGKRRAWRQTQKKTMEGNVVTFSAMAVVGDGKGHVGVGLGKSKETLPSRTKALRNPI